MTSNLEDFVPYAVEHLNEVGCDLNLDTYNLVHRRRVDLDELTNYVEQITRTSEALKAVVDLDDNRAADAVRQHDEQIQVSLDIVQTLLAVVRRSTD